MNLLGLYIEMIFNEKLISMDWWMLLWDNALILSVSQYVTRTELQVEYKDLFSWDGGDFMTNTVDSELLFTVTILINLNIYHLIYSRSTNCLSYYTIYF